MAKDDKDIKSGTSHDKMKYCILEWKGITFWGVPDPKTEGAFVSFEVYSLRKFVSYKMVALVPSAKSHPSGWNLDIIRFGEKKPVSQINKHEIMQKASFEELFAVMGVLVEEEENPNLFEFVSPKETDRLKRKWKRWMKDIPEWLDATIKATNERLIIRSQEK